MQLSEASEAFGEALRDARSLTPPRPAEEALIVHCPRAEAPAYQLYLGYTHSGRRAAVASCLEVAVHLAPYRSLEYMIVYSIGGRDHHLIHLAEASRLLEAEIIVYAPQAHPLYEEKLSELGTERILVKSRHPLMAMTLASLLWGPELLGARAERLKQEIGELEDAPTWVAETLGDAIERASRLEGIDMILYTPATRPAAYYLREALYRKIGYMVPVAPLEELSLAPRGSRGISIYTSVEEHGYREALLSARMRGVELVELRLNTDPVTANIYAMIASAMITGLMP